jgi:cysteine-rich repeat protein
VRRRWLALDSNEQCDDHNRNDDDGCSSSCELEPGFECAVVNDPVEPTVDDPVVFPETRHTVCNAICGDDIRVDPEQCDDGTLNGTADSLCTVECTLAGYCGDGKVDAGEICDDGLNVDVYATASQPDACAPGCTTPHFCGDGIVDVQFDEQCDRGAENATPPPYGGCSADCQLGARCGDGEVQAPEECDGRNLRITYGCNAACKNELGWLALLPEECR